MKNILVIDTSDNILKLALTINGKSFFCYEVNAQKHVEILIPRIKSLFEEANAEVKALNEIYVCCGPGSFTGLRIGITTAITLSFSLNVPVFGFCAFSVFDYLVKDKDVLFPLVDGKKHQFYCTFITEKFNSNELFDYTYDEIKEKLHTMNGQITVCGKDSSLIKENLISDGFNCKFEYEDGYSSQDMLNYILSLPENHGLLYPEPIYIRKSEAEIELMNRKK